VVRPAASPFLLLVIAALVVGRGAFAQTLLQVTKLTSTPVVSAGEAVIFSVIVQNVGAITATDVLVTDTLPGGMTWTENNSACSISLARFLTCNFGNLPPGAVGVVAVSAVTDRNDCGTLDNTATGSASNAASQQDSASITVNCPSLVVGAFASAAVSRPDSAHGLTIALRNTGPGTAKGVTLDVALPIGNYTLSPPMSGCVFTTGKVSCSVGDLDPGEGRAVGLVTFSGQCGTYTATADVGASNHDDVSDEVSFAIRQAGDADGNCDVHVQDVFRLINFLFAAGAPPV